MRRSVCSRIRERIDETGQDRLICLFLCGMTNFAITLGVALQAPFYPHEAEKKGATATEYGIVYGAFQFTMFILSPPLGQYIRFLNAGLLVLCGGLLSGGSLMIFGFLQYVDGHAEFIGFSLALRILAGAGEAAFFTACYARVVEEFPDNMTTATAVLEAFYGVGHIAGPLFGGLLYNIGGFILPFEVAGSFLIILVFSLSWYLSPEPLSRRASNGQTNFDDVSRQSLLQQTDESLRVRPTLLSISLVPRISLSTVTIIVSTFGYGFISATMEPHVRVQLNMNPGDVALLFFCGGLFYAITATAWGRFCDAGLPPKFAMFLATFFSTICFLLVGPVSFIPGKLNLWMIIASMTAFGIGMAGQIVTSFNNAVKEAIKNGFTNDLNLYGVISGLWNTAFCFGAFVGPTIGGFLVDKYNFRIASVLAFAMNAVMLVVLMIWVIYDGELDCICLSFRRKRQESFGSKGIYESAYEKKNALDPTGLSICNSLALSRSV